MNKRFLTYCLFLLVYSFSFSQSPSWANSFGGDGRDFLTDIVVDDAGNTYLLGFFRDTIDVDPGPGEQLLPSAGFSDIFICQYGASGQLNWAHRLGGVVLDYGDGLALSKNGGIWLTGSFTHEVDFDPGPGTFFLTSQNFGQDAFLLELDRNGNLLQATSIGGDQIDRGEEIVIDEDGNVFLVGAFESPVIDLDPGLDSTFAYRQGNSDGFLIKFDSTLNFEWGKHFHSNSFWLCQAMDLGPQGDIHLAGLYNSTSDFDPGPDSTFLTPLGFNVFVCQLSKQGDFKWVRQIGGYSTDGCGGMVVDNSGNVYVAGNFEVNADLDPGPGQDWHFGEGEEDCFLLKMDSLGNRIWSSAFGGTAEDQIEDLAVAATGEVYTVGSFMDTVDFDPGLDSFLLSVPPTDGRDGFIQSFGPNGNLLDVLSLGGFGSNIPNCVALESSGSLIAAGHFFDEIDLAPDSSSDIHFSAGDLDIFILKLDRITGSNELSSVPQLELWPNPTQDMVHVASTPSPRSLRIWSIEGKLLKQVPGSEISLAELPSGFFALEVQFKHGSAWRRVIKR